MFEVSVEDFLLFLSQADVIRYGDPGVERDETSKGRSCVP